ncbi:MAG: hypothetical protein U5K37_12820 [Natrialbaceae archaeon]|nr:hypothetical protein [Natrialbaceae archaeon]
MADYDLVITADAPLSLALNRRLERPRLGRFAATPRMLASGQFRPHDRRTLVLELIEQTGLDWKQIDYLVGTLLGCWEATGDRRAILEYDRFDTPGMRTALDVVEQIGSAHGDIASVTIPPDQDVAVIAPDHLSALDRQVLPEDYDTIDPFTDESVELPPFRIFESTTAIVETVLENVTAETAEDIAIIMDPTSEYPTLVESALAAHAIPFHGGPGFADDEGVRTVLRLLRVATGPKDVRLSAVRPILHVLGENVPIADDDRRLFALEHDVLAPSRPSVARSTSSPSAT